MTSFPTSSAIGVAFGFGNVMLAGSKSAGHCFTPVFATSSAVGVQVNGKSPVLRGDPYVGPHFCGDKSHPPGVADCRQNRVLVNGKPIHLTGDKISCGDVALGLPGVGLIIGG